MSTNADTVTACRYILNKYLREHPSVRRTVCALLAHPRLPRPRLPKDIPYRAYSHATKTGILAALIKGERNRDVAAAYGVSPTFVTKIRMKNNIPTTRQWG